MSQSEAPLNNISPSAIMQMATGFWVSKTLMTAVELGVFTKISAYQKNNNGIMTLREFQNIIRIEESRPAEAFTTALVSLGLLKVNKNNNGEKTFANSEVSSMFLDKSKSTYIGDVIAMFDERLYKRWDKLSEALKTNKPIGEGQGEDIESIFDKGKSNQEVEQLQKFTHAMHGVSIGPAMALAKNVDFSNHKKMMDIGGGSGVYAIQVVANNPNNMSAVVLDSKPVCHVADRYIQPYNLQDKVQTMTFDFFKDQLPNDCDVAFLSHVLRIFDRDKNITLLKKIYDSLHNENSTILISEWLLNDEKTGPIASALMGLTMIVENSGGRGYSYNEILQMLTEVGFKNIERRPLIEPAEIVIGYKK
ncbi:MAG: acetylserotonin O-methyltransferase [Thermoproteota archaeon]|nr:acetylserotonin O-methyltransferase [Thermoproteota archaeon]